MDINTKTTSLGLREVTVYSIPENGRTFIKATCLAVSLFNLDILWFYLNVPNGTIRCEKHFLIYSKVLKYALRKTLIFCTKKKYFKRPQKHYFTLKKLHFLNFIQNQLSINSVKQFHWYLKMNISIMKLFAFFVGIISQILFYPKIIFGKMLRKIAPWISMVFVLLISDSFEG